MLSRTTIAPTTRRSLRTLRAIFRSRQVGAQLVNAPAPPPSTMTRVTTEDRSATPLTSPSSPSHPPPSPPLRPPLPPPSIRTSLSTAPSKRAPPQSPEPPYNARRTLPLSGRLQPRKASPLGRADTG